MAHVGDDIVQLELVKDIEIRNFSIVNQCSKAREYFVIRGDEFPVIFCVSIYPNGLSSNYQNSVSVQFFKLLIDRDTSPCIQKHNVSWTLSIIDINGDGHYYQSFSKDNVTGYPYNLVITDFKNRSAILEDADNFLPGDVLTIRCEFFCISEKYMTTKTSLFEEWLLTYDRVWAEEIWSNVNGISSVENFDGYDDFYTTYAIRLNLQFNEDDTYSIVCLCRQMDTIIGTFLQMIVTYISYMNLANLDSQLDAWSKSIPSDKFRKTYLKCNCIFHAYIHVKEKIRKEYNYIHLDEKALEPGYHFYRKWFSIPLAKRKGLLVNRLGASENDCNSEKDDFDQIFLFAEKERCIIEEVIAKNLNLYFNNYEDGWNCIVDAIVFFMLDEDKLDIFENTMKYPIGKKMVRLVDINSMMHLLHYLHNGDVKTESFNELCKLYKLAHIHHVKNLMFLCSEKMRPSILQNNLNELKRLINHDDDNLINMVKSFENLNDNKC